jgi:tetratricopeptide (TPR) repeat protein
MWVLTVCCPFAIHLQALTKWGGALLELAHFRQGHEAYAMIEDAIEKFQGAIEIDPDNRHDALWCLGNAYTSQGFLSANAEVSAEFFTKAAACFEKAAEMDPDNESYKRALEMSSKAPQLYAELQKQLEAANEEAMLEAKKRGGNSSGAKDQPGDTKAAAKYWSDTTYDALGWACLVGIGFGIAALSSK